ncbi:MAG: septum formation inhibitor Maf [Methylococcaceae bacterium]|nr:septum formation inhibitor Maf [Methylococcaceae bacterium]
MTIQLILASASPRRKELLDQIKVRYSVYPVDIDETPRLNEAPLDYVLRIAGEKSLAGVQGLGSETPVLAADTVVVLGAQIMGKPRDQDDAIAMLSQLSGKTHQVFSAVSLRGHFHHQAVSITDVTFRPLTHPEILSYWLTGEPHDKAGSYAIQGLGALFVESINGSFTGVVGLPLFETAELLLKQGIIIFK